MTQSTRDRYASWYAGSVLAKHQTLVMGIVNVTPDSFFDGGRYFDVASAGEHMARLIEEGADLLDLVL